MSKVTPEAKDIAAFIALALQAISDGVDVSVAAWEKRDYWVKADKFRMEWRWAGMLAEKMKSAVLGDDWATIASLLPSDCASSLIESRSQTITGWASPGRMPMPCWRCTESCKHGWDTDKRMNG